MDHSRNWLFISPSTQSILSQKKILIVGLGIGSVFAEIALRTGLRHMTICDGDQVSDSNLNRQNYTARDVGVSKAQATADRLQSIDPGIFLRVYDRFADEGLLSELIPQHDYIINTIDFDAPEFSLCTKLSQEHKKMELFPINLGFGCAVTVFDHTAPQWRDVFPVSPEANLKTQILSHLIQSGRLAPYLVSAAQEYFQTPNVEYDPQLGISCQLVASLMMRLIIKDITKEKLGRFPYFYYLDASL